MSNEHVRSSSVLRVLLSVEVRTGSIFLRQGRMFRLSRCVYSIARLRTPCFRDLRQSTSSATVQTINID